MKPTKIPPVHPGEILLGDFMEPLGLTQYALAKALGVPALRISQIVRGQRAISADTALRLGRFFGTSAQFWLTLQTRCDLDLAEDRISEQLGAIAPIRVA